MATSKATDTKTVDPGSTRPAQADQPTDTPAPDTAPSGRDRVVSDCVVNGGKGMHVGRAVNGKVCSYHAMQYRADGTPR